MAGLLGKKPATQDLKDIRFSLLREAAAEVTPVIKVPTRFGHGTIFSGTRWQMLGNGPDNSVAPGFKGAGCCVWSTYGHIAMEAAKINRHTLHIGGAQTIQDYASSTGYVIGDDSTDNGTDMREGMKYWQKTGILDADGHRHKVGAYIALDPKDWDQLMEAVYIFGWVAMGFDFPQSAWQQFDEGGPWDVVPDSPSDGGHAVPVFGRSSLSIAGDVSWARRIGMTRAFYEARNDESWTGVFPDELRNGKTERGWDLTQLQTELNKLGISF